MHISRSTHSIESKKRREGVRAVLALLIACTLLASFSCVRAPRPKISTREEAFKKVSIEDLRLEADPLSIKSFLTALKGSISYYEKVPPTRIYHFGRYMVTADKLLRSYKSLRDYAEAHPSFRLISRFIKTHFDALKCNGYRGDGRLLFTGYYEPRVPGSLKKTGRFVYPLYSLPDDLIYVDLKSFGFQSPKKRLTGRIDGRMVRPYFTRYEIDFEKKLAGKGYELVWLDDIVDCFFIHVQGSAEIVLPDGNTISVNYAGSNGHPYKSIGALLIDEGKIPREKMSMEAIYTYLHAHPSEIKRVLSCNSSYVFFRKVKNGPIGSIGIILTPRRSVAADPKFFPPGALAFVRVCSSPDRNGCGRNNAIEFKHMVFIQDRGGAIKGPGRIDYYWGKGKKAGNIAGSFKPWGEFFVFVPRDESFSRL